MGMSQRMGDALSYMPNAVASSYPRFKKRIAQVPQDALNQMAQYEQNNPIGSMNQAMIGGIGALGFGAANKAGRVFKGLEGADKFEFSDLGAKLNDLPKALTDGKLGDVLDHPELYRNYPDLQGMTVRKQIPTMENQMAGTKGAFNPNDMSITVAPGQDAKSSLLHEIQHVIQDKENFAQGGNPATINDSLSSIHKQDQVLFDRLRQVEPNSNEYLNLRNQRDSLRQQAQDITEGTSGDMYKRLAGESEARNVEKRMNMTDAERSANPFNQTHDVPLNDQILRMKSAKQAMSFPELVERLRKSQS